MRRFFVLFLASLMLVGLIDSIPGEVIKDELVSRSLQGNLLNDPSVKPMMIYLPPSYADENTRYPVVYYLHGFTNTETVWTTNGLDNLMDHLIEQGEVQEMIIVMPNANNRFNGSWYANSSVAGNYEDYMTQDLVEFVDRKYRTLPHRQSRAIAGVSMGGHGAMKLAIKHPEIYSTVVSQSGVLSLNRWKGVPADINPAFPAMAIAFSPNPNQPLGYDYPIDETGNVREEIWQRWLEHDPVTLVETHRENLKQLSGIYLDHGRSDGVVGIDQARDFDSALTKAGITHVYEEYEGGHVDPTRFNITLPFLSRTLSTESVTDVSLQGKLATTWGRIKNSVR
ncbi:MAG: alpha/beta hydrolase family protein [Nitrospirota bacterium]|nr:alpha/beta hydrolase family protein [Nitrospirota bacterium]